MADEEKDGYMCYNCTKVSSNPNDILLHTIKEHITKDNFTIRKKIFDENIFKIGFKSIHFSVTVMKLVEVHKKGLICNVNCDDKRITFKRKRENNQDDNKHIESQSISTQTESETSELYSVWPQVIDVLNAMGRYDDFMSIMKCIRDGILHENIAFHLLLDVGNFYSKQSINAVRYSSETITFWLTVQKLFKGKGVNFFRGFKAQGTPDSSIVSPRDCRINFSVPSNPILHKESLKYTVNASNPGLLQIPLDAFAVANKGKDVKLSIDGKKIAVGLGKNGDENLGGFEVAPTLSERKGRFQTETNKITELSTPLEEVLLGGVENVKDVNTDMKRTMKESLLVSIGHLSVRVKEIREFVVKRKEHLRNLLKTVEGDWKQSKLAGAISYWQTKLIHAQTSISDLLECIDKLGYAVSCINGTSKNYILGCKSSIQLENQSNYICLRDIILNNDDLDHVDSSITKQRTERWHKMRKESRVTGSTLFKALGLGTLREQQEHFDKVFCGVEKPISATLQNILDYGTKQEINALGTTIGKILPVYFPDLTYIEDGCEVLLLGDSKAVISGDGTGSTGTRSSSVGFEFKCPIPDKTHKTDLHYSLPVHYTTQVLSQMAAKRCERLAFISYTPESVAFISVKMNKDLWLKVWELTVDLYGSGEAHRPTRRNPKSKELLDLLKEYSDQSTFVAEFPSLKAEACRCQPTENIESIHGYHGNDSFTRDDLSLTEILTALESSKQSLSQAYELMRKPAKEVLVTVISDLDRQATSLQSIAHAVPIHYGLSGFSLTMKTVRGILGHIVTEVTNRDLNVKSIAFDGQFLELSIEDEDGKALTICRLMKQFWESIKKMNRNEKRQYLLNLNSLPRIETMDDVLHHFEYNKTFETGITLKLRSGIKFLGSPSNVTKVLRNKFASEIDEHQCNNKDTSLEECNSEYANLDEQREIDILQFLPDSVVSCLDEQSKSVISKIVLLSDKEDINEKDQEINTDNVSVDFEEALVSLIAMSDEKSTKWNGYSLDEFKAVFDDAKTINKTLTVHELKMLADLSKIPPKDTKDCRKPELVNLISQIYGKGSKMDIPVSNPKSLKTLASNAIKSWSIEAVNVAYAQLTFPEALRHWDANNMFKGSWDICTETGILSIPQWYAQPSQINGVIIEPIVDPHHIFVNNRCICCSKGMPGMGIEAQAWWNVAKESRRNNTGLSLELAKELRDRQSNSYAQTTFSSKVQLEMEKNGNMREAHWCKLLRHWYQAIDEGGVPVHTRIQYLMDVRAYLLQFLKIGHFPPVGYHVAGMPIAQFEGILCNVDRRIQLYAMVKDGSYNHRSITSLDSETFFSGFQDYDPKGTGVLRADDIPTALGTATFLYKQRLDTNRKFFMKTSQRTRVYPVRSLDECDSNTNMDDSPTNPFENRVIQIRSHQFDTNGRRNEKPKRKSGAISQFGLTARGAEGARAYHRANEEKILSHRRSGLNDDDLLFK